ncbi:hypothetical protein [Rheinheimera sp.]|uniref:hypothetical protein n=1 Tax=Rheinheimera sp. TaxID=1869214 RepID=UPI00307FCB2E
MNQSSLFIEHSLGLLRDRLLLLVSSALLCALVAAAFATWLPPVYQSQAVLTLTDWQVERLTRRDPALDKNPANVGGAAADEMSRALLQLQSAELWAELQAQPAQLSFEHKRRGNLVALRWTSQQPGQASQQLTELVQLWDQRLQQRFIAERQHLMQQVPDPLLAAELQQAEALHPFALQWLQPPSGGDKALSRPWFWWAVFAAVTGFLLIFQLLLFRRLQKCSQ